MNVYNAGAGMCLALAAVQLAWANAALETDLSASQPAPWTSLAVNDDDANFHFVIVSDRTGGARAGVFESAIPKVNLLEPAFVLSVGDLIEGNTDDQAQLDREWDEFESFVAQLEAPFFYAAGNHDMSNAVMAETWQARFGPSYYRFLYKDVLFLVLNSELFGMVRDVHTPVPGPWTQAEQMAFIADTLRRFPNPRWTIVVIHQPRWDYDDAPQEDWRRVEQLLGERDYTVFAGHSHRYVKLVRQDRRYITLATTGGGSSMRGLAHGEFDHVALVSMTDSGPRIANLTLDGIHDENLVTAASRTAVRQLRDAVYSVPLLGDGALFESGAAAFAVANVGSTALRVAYNVAPGALLTYAGQPQPFTLAPGQTKHVRVPVSATVPVPYHAITPGRVVWSLATEVGGKPYRLEQTSALLPVASLPMPSGPVPRVDGDLADWSTLPFHAHRQGDVAAPPTAPTDIAYAFGLREADGDVYFAARVADDDVFASANLGPQVQDGLLLVVDARDDPERSANVRRFQAGRRGHLARMALGYITVEQAAADPSLRRLAQSRAAVTSQTRRTAGGYVVEAKVSGAFLDAQADGTWQTLRIGVTAVDWDTAEVRNRIPWHVHGSSGTALHWQPDRFGAAPVAGSGTFERRQILPRRTPAVPE